MKKILFLCAAMLAMTFAACSDNDTDYLPARHFDDATAPSVVSVSPEDGASELDTFVNVVVTYDEPVYAAPQIGRAHV